MEERAKRLSFRNTTGPPVPPLLLTLNLEFLSLLIENEDCGFAPLSMVINKVLIASLRSTRNYFTEVFTNKQNCHRQGDIKSVKNLCITKVRTEDSEGLTICL